jgi:hypothetical protein
VFALLKIQNSKHQIPSKHQNPMIQMTQTKKVFIGTDMPGVGNADLRSLQKKIFNAFVLGIGICLEFVIWNLFIS